MRKQTRTCGSLLKWSRDPHSPCEWAGPSDSLLWIDQRAKWWNVTSKTRLQKDYGFWWAPYLLLFLSGKLAAMLRVAYGETHVARSRCPQPTASEDLRAADGHVSEFGDAFSPYRALKWLLSHWQLDCSLVSDPETKTPRKVLPGSWSTETLR